MRKNFWVLSLFSILSLSCATKTVEQPSEASERVPAAPAAATATPSPAPVAMPEIKLVPAQAPTAAAHSNTVAKADSHASHHGHHEAKGTAPEKALGWLKNGNTRYRKGFLRKDGQTTKDIQRLAKGQAPHSIILSCSDSRVPPEVVFDQKLGEVFVVRNAGEIPDQASIASIEYAVEHLGSRLIVVMGHTSCGAVKAALSTLEGGDAGSPALNALVKDIHPRIASFKGQKPAANVESESWANARGIAQELLARSQILQEKVSSGQVQIKAALYHLDDGKVAFDP